MYALAAKGNPAIQKLLEESFEHGIELDRKEGRDQGRKEGLLRGIELACGVLGIDLTEERRAELASLDVAGLEARMTRLQAERRW